MDRVTTITSVTLLPSKDFKTPQAPYSYKHISKNRYPVGYSAVTNNSGESFLIARPEKALIDYVSIRAKNLIIKTAGDIQEFLENDLRLDLNEFFEVTDIENLKELLPYYHRNSKEFRILKWLKSRKENSAWLDQ